MTVTGSAVGIGATIAETFAHQGNRVTAVDVDQQVLDETVATLVAAGHGVRGFPVDVTDSAAMDVVIAEIERTVGLISVLVNCAGVLRTRQALDTPDADWAALFAVNATGVFTVSRAVARRMFPRRAGAIVTVSSNTGRTPRAGMAGYSSFKAAATMFTKSLGLKLAGDNIRCNVVAPGSTDTLMLRGMRSDTKTESEWLGRVVAGSPEEYKAGIPLRKVAQPNDITQVVHFLASPAASHITMQKLYVDGGAALGG